MSTDPIWRSRGRSMQLYSSTPVYSKELIRRRVVMGATNFEVPGTASAAAKGNELERTRIAPQYAYSFTFLFRFDHINLLFLHLFFHHNCETLSSPSLRSRLL